MSHHGTFSALGAKAQKHKSIVFFLPRTPVKSIRFAHLLDPLKGDPHSQEKAKADFRSLEGKSGPAGLKMLAGAPVYRLPLRGSPYLSDLERCLDMSPARVMFVSRNVTEKLPPAVALAVFEVMS